MSEQVNGEGQVEPQVQEPSPVEQDARGQGWVPKEEFDGDESKWVDAAEFVRRGELFRKIDVQNREIKETKKTLAALKEHYTKVEEAAFNRALTTLKAQKVLAQEEGEFRRASQLDEEIKQVEEEKAALKEAILDVPKDVHPELAAWVDRNTWYQTNQRMRAVADAIGFELSAQGVTGPALLKAIDSEIRKEFPTKFTNPNREKPGSVEGGGNKSATAGKKDSFQLTEQETKIMNSLIRDKVLTKEDYIRDIKLQRGEK